jgi:HrpA-like RNA helicase
MSETGAATKLMKNGLVGYQIRYDATTIGDNTRIKFMTEGILLKEINQVRMKTKGKYFHH